MDKTALAFSCFVSALMWVIIIMVAMWLVGCSGWSRADTYRQAAFVGVSAVDWMQTRYIASHPDKYYERNPFLGRHPSVSQVDLWCLGTTLGNTAIAMLLPPKIRPWWQYLSIGWEGAMVANNFSIGIGFGW